MPNGRRVSLLKVLVRAGIFARMAPWAAVLAKALFHKQFFKLLSGTQTSPRIRLGGRSFQKIKQPLHSPPVFTANPPDLCDATRFIDFIVRCTRVADVREPGLPADEFTQSGKDSTMVKVEDIQQYGKEQLETVVASATTMQHGIQAIASAYGDYTKKSFEDTKSMVEKLSGVKSLDKAIEVQTEFAKSSYETFVAESQKIAGLYTDLAKQTFKPFEGLVAKFTPAATH